MEATRPGGAHNPILPSDQQLSAGIPFTLLCLAAILFQFAVSPLIVLLFTCLAFVPYFVADERTVAAAALGLTSAALLVGSILSVSLYYDLPMLTITIMGAPGGYVTSISSRDLRLRSIADVWRWLTNLGTGAVAVSGLLFVLSVPFQEALREDELEPEQLLTGLTQVASGFLVLSAACLWLLAAGMAVSMLVGWVVKQLLNRRFSEMAFYEPPSVKS